MINSRWENEIALLRKDIQALEGRIKINLKSEKLLILQKRAVILQYQLAIEKMVDKFQRLTRGKIPLPPRAKAIIHWGHIIADKTLHLYQRKSVFWDMTMWQNLIKSRLIGSSQLSDMYIEDHDLISMATKLDLLKQTESRLNVQLVDLKETKKKLTEERKTISTKLSNIHAAQSLQTEKSAIPQKITENPIYLMLKSYVNWLTLPLRSFTDVERQFQNDYKEVIKKTHSTVAYCRNLALAELGHPASRAYNHEELANLKEELVRIDHLHANMESSIAKIFREKPPLPRPVIRKELTQ